MKKTTFLLFCIWQLCTEVSSQSNRYIIQFKNKGTSPFSISNPGAYLSARAIARRTKYGLSIDSTDLPITPRYLDSLKSVPNVTMLNRTKWLNAVVIYTTDATALTKINSFTFVQSINPIAAIKFPGDIELPVNYKNETLEPLADFSTSRTSSLNINYGQTTAVFKVRE